MFKIQHLLYDDLWFTDPRLTDRYTTAERANDAIADFVKRRNLWDDARVELEGHLDNFVHHLVHVFDFRVVPTE